MSFDAIKDVQTAVLAKMTGDVVLMGRITGVFDEAPSAQAYPYITFGQKDELPWNVFQKHGWEVILALDIWTAIAGGDVHMSIADDIGRLFNDPLPLLALANYVNVLCQVAQVITMTDEVVSVRHTIARLHTINVLP